MDIQRFRAARNRGAAWLLAQLNADGSIGPSEVGTFYYRGELELFVRAGVTNSGWASVVPSPGHENVAVRVPAVTIDGYVAAEGLEQVRLVKMDIEGAEPGALAGGAQLFSRDDAPDVLCEVNPFLLDRAGSSAADLLQRFEGYGYRLFRIDRSGFTELHASTAESALMNVIATKAPARVLSA